ncbi:zinc finger CHC2-family protein [Ammonifex degensii KC4]|uniref:Zinc finger CHC2-family protein n=1 Tax=Ammonifex degensii (strain DSM 10501 / KC4) TaxID=429009 RepID=C9RA92_AMMDK|nr:CHC2 zinc finger domain-containing protein [Ammonifex degensii]ACX51201.1 zinc finger CHC2-family protein [Ammonifex degensii KC4]
MASVACSIDLFQLAREVSLLEVIRHFAPGLELTRKGRELVACCPFHPDREPSFYVNPAKNVFFCFGCGAGGDGVEFVARTLGLGRLEAARAIVQEFGLVAGSRCGARRESAAGLRRARIAKAVADRLEREIADAYRDLCLIIRTTEKTLARALAEKDVKTVENLAELVKSLPWLTHVADLLYSNDPEERLAALEEARRWI